MRKISIIVILILVSLTTQVLATPTVSKTPAQLYFELFYQSNKSEDEIIRVFETCTDEILKSLVELQEYYRGQTDGGEAEIQAAMRAYDAQHPEGGNFDYTRWQEVANAMQRSFSSLYFIYTNDIKC